MTTLVEFPLIFSLPLDKFGSIDSESKSIWWWAIEISWTIFERLKGDRSTFDIAADQYFYLILFVRYGANKWQKGALKKLGIYFVFHY